MTSFHGTILSKEIGWCFHQHILLKFHVSSHNHICHNQKTHSEYHISILSKQFFDIRNQIHLIRNLSCKHPSNQINQQLKSDLVLFQILQHLLKLLFDKILTIRILEMRNNQHVSPRDSKNVLQPSQGSLKLHTTLESQCKNFAYEMIELQMSIENQNSPPVGATKLEDISKLIQIYMIGVESLESMQDQRYQYFGKKLEALMLKKTVVCQLYKGAKSPDIPKKIGEQKRKQHQVHLFYNKQQHEKGKIKELISNIDKKLERYSGTVKNQMKTQQQSIQERIRLRKLRSENGSVSKFEMSGGSPVILSPTMKSSIQHKLSQFDDLPTGSIQKRAMDDNFQTPKQSILKNYQDV